MQKLLKEAFFVGILMIVVGTLISFILSKVSNKDIPPVCKDWNKNYIMELSLFLTGFVAHIICEYIGLNKWYCKNGNACN